MGAKVSKEMEKAMTLIRGGMKPAQAAAAVGIQRSTVSRSRLYQDWLKEQQAHGAQKGKRDAEL